MKKNDLVDKVLGRKDKYQFANMQRLFHLLYLFNDERRILYNSIPFLLNVNSSEFPGFVPDSTLGIDGYRADESTIKDISIGLNSSPKTVSKAIETSEGSSFIKGLFLMGSLSSVAQTEDSDFDYWVIVDEKEKESPACFNLKEKCVILEQWALDYCDAEVHFFVLTQDDVKADYFGEVDEESAGSSLGKLLKDEFYRSSILIMGRIPYFWVTPPNCTDDEYRQTVLTCDAQDGLKRNFLDLGNINTIETEEFFGALLWQLFKGIHSPFKSVLKMGLLHYYFSTGETILCNEYKRLVFEDNLRETDRDAYLLMFDKVSSFYQKSENSKALDTLRKSFLLKMQSFFSKEEIEGYSRLPDSIENHKCKVVGSFLEGWGWNYETFVRFSDHRKISLNDNIEFGKEILQFMLYVYESVADDLKLKQKGKNKISDHDLTILGKKVISRISPKKGKTKILPLGTRSNTTFPYVTICRSFKANKESWSLYYGRLSKSDISSPKGDTSHLLSSQSLIEIITFIVYNRLVNFDSQIEIFDSLKRVSNQDVEHLLKELQLFFIPVSSTSTAGKSIFEEAEYTFKIFYVLNFTNRSSKKDVIEEMTIIYQNSLGEIFLKKIEGCLAYTKGVERLTESLPPKIGGFSDYFRVFVGESPFSYFLKVSFTDKLNQHLLQQVGERRKGSRSKLDLVGYDGIMEAYDKKRYSFNPKIDTQ